MAEDGVSEHSAGGAGPAKSEVSPSLQALSPTARSPIALLDEGTVACIAAGEVVERPAAAVKELVENSLDAGASRVRIEYDDRGAVRIVITDDGCGIEDAEIDLALTRHATSKIRTLADVETVSTFGFRGEALAAIASASDLELVTAVEGRTGGTRVVVRGGRIVERAPSPSRRGTRLEVQDLFATVPARRKFLKGTATEAGYVTDVVRRFALARPDVHFVLSVSGRITLDVAPVTRLHERILQVYGKDVAASLIEVDARFGGFRLRGFLSGPGTAFGNSKRMAMFVGGRWVREKLLFQSVLDGYQTYLLKGRFPASVLFFDCDSGDVDVNVHPAKLEVRFSEADAVRRFVTEAVRDALRRSASPLGRWGIDSSESLRRRAVPSAGPGAVAAARTSNNDGRFQRDASGSGDQWASSASRLAAEDVFAQRASGNAPASAASGDSPATPALVSAGPEERAADSQIPGYTPSSLETLPRSTDGEQLPIDLGAERHVDALGRFEVVGQIFEGYFVCEGDGEVLLVDQHAAHERVLFERLVTAFAERRVSSQALLIAQRVVVGAEGVEACVAATEELAALGWEIEAFGDDEVVVRAAPAMAGGADTRTLVEAIANDLVEGGRARAAENLAQRVMATVACHSAVRVGKRLDVAAARALLREMSTVSYHATCPHGRPVAKRLGRGQVERMFGR